MAIRAFRGIVPTIAPDAFVEESAQVVGDVVIGSRSSVWFNAVVRADVNPIRIGEQSNVQDLCCLHVTRARFPLTIGNRVTVGHGALLHGCTLGDLCFIGMGAIVLDGAEVGEGSLIAAGALVTPGTRVPAGSLVLGSPGRVVRLLTAPERARHVESAANYLEYLKQHRDG